MNHVLYLLLLAELNEVLIFIRGPLNEDAGAVKKRNMERRIAVSVHIWKCKWEKAQQEEKELIAGKKKVEAQIEQVICSKELTVAFKDDQINKLGRQLVEWNEKIKENKEMQATAKKILTTIQAKSAA